MSSSCWCGPTCGRPRISSSNLSRAFSAVLETASSTFIAYLFSFKVRFIFFLIRFNLNNKASVGSPLKIVARDPRDETLALPSDPEPESEGDGGPPPLLRRLLCPLLCPALIRPSRGPRPPSPRRPPSRPPPSRPPPRPCRGRGGVLRPLSPRES